MESLQSIMDGMSAYSSEDEFLRDLKKELELITGTILSKEYVKEAGDNLRTLMSDIINC